MTLFFLQPHLPRQTPTFLYPVHAENWPTEVLLGCTSPRASSCQEDLPLQDGFHLSNFQNQWTLTFITSKIISRMWASKHWSHPDAGDKRSVDGCRNGAIVKTSWTWGVTRFCRAAWDGDSITNSAFYRSAVSTHMTDKEQQRLLALYLESGNRIKWVSPIMYHPDSGHSPSHWSKW